MLYICKFSNKFDLIQAIRVSHSWPWLHLTLSKVAHTFILKFFHTLENELAYRWPLAVVSNRSPKSLELSQVAASNGLMVSPITFQLALYNLSLCLISP